MPWRRQTALGARYGSVCPRCALLRGWNRRAAVERHIADLVAEGFVLGVEAIEEFAAGADGTCACDVDVAPISDP